MENYVKFKLKSWIDINKLDWAGLSSNPHPKAIELLQRDDLENPRQGPYEIYWDILCKNPGAIALIKQNPDKINWYLLSSNPCAIELLEENPDKIDWDELSLNPAAIQLLKQNQDKINWNMLSTNPNAIKLLKQNPYKIDWGYLSSNPNAIQLLYNKRKNGDYPFKWYYGAFYENTISLDYLAENPLLIPIFHKGDCQNSNHPYDRVCFQISSNAIYVNIYENSNIHFWVDLSKNPNAIDLLKEHPDKINWSNLSKNPNPTAMGILEQNQDKIDWKNLSKNPNIFEIDTYHYTAIKERMDIFRQELLEIALHPNRIDYFHTV